MANTKDLNKIKAYVVEQLSSEFGQKLLRKKVIVGQSSSGKDVLKTFDGVSDDGRTIVAVACNGGKTSGDKKPSGKINDVLATCFVLNLIKAERKVLVLVNEEFYTIFKKDWDGLLSDIELMYFDLPSELKEVVKSIQAEASKEMNQVALS